MAEEKKHTGGSETDETGRAVKIAEHMNKDHAASLLVYVWNEGYKNAKFAIMKSIDKKGMDIEAFFGKGKSSTIVRVNFETPLSSLKDARPAVVKMHYKSLQAQTIMARFKMEVLAVMAIIGTPFFVVFFPDMVRQMLSVIFKISTGTMAKASNVCMKLCFLLLAAHSLEFLYCVYRLRSIRLKLGRFNFFVWFLHILIIGYPATRKFLEIVDAQKLVDKKLKEM